MNPRILTILFTPLIGSLLALTGTSASAGMFDDFSIDPNITTEWTEYGYYNNTDATTPSWDSGNGELDLNKPTGLNGLGLYRTGMARTPTESVTMTVNSFSMASGAWGFMGLMLSTILQPAYVANTPAGFADTYTLRLSGVNTTDFRFKVTRTWRDGTGDYVLYESPADITFSGPYALTVERVGNEYVFKVDGAAIYTTGTAGGDFYSTAVKDTMLSYQIVLAGEGVINASVDDFGVPGATAADQYQQVVNVDVQGGNQAAYAWSGGAPDLSGNVHWNLLNTANGYNASNLTASDGTTATTIDVSLPNWFSTFDAGSEGNTLQSDRIYDQAIGGGDGVGTFTINGLEAGKSYDIYLYTAGFETDYTINAVTRTATSADAGVVPSWVQGTHYALFEGIKGGAAVNGTATNGSSVFSVLSGMQIAEKKKGVVILIR
ncbi:MAG TPA: hypothetical protein DCR55_12670 [Lentisphaeria bacterium]|nr:hypothetical protein [Lentisphaeria bacterium]